MDERGFDVGRILDYRRQRCAKLGVRLSKHRPAQNGFPDPTRTDWHKHPIFAACKSADGGYQRIIKHSDEFIARMGYERDGKVYKITAPSEKRIAAFCHHGLGTAWLSHLLSIPPLFFWSSFDISHSSVTILEFRNNADGLTAPQCHCLSDISHIYNAGLPINSVIEFW